MDVNPMGDHLRLLNIVFLGTTFLGGIASAANAADVYPSSGSFKDEPVAYVSPMSWAGFYAGIHAGYRFDDELKFTTDGNSASLDIASGFVGGIQVGYNWQRSPNWVFGIEGSLSILNDELDDGGLQVSDYLATIRGRVGYAVGNSLFYGTAGVALVSWADDIKEILTDNTTVGFVAGLGYERKVASNLSFGVEGLYYNFSTKAAVDDPEDPFTLDVDRDFWTVQARLNYHFSSERDAPLK
jgi:outer membrane immunogenic protein